MPELHGAHMVKQAPELRHILMETVDFENLLYIWEFLNNFSDFLDLPNFYIQELQATLMFCDTPEKVHTHFEQDLDSSQEITNDPMQGLDWNQMQSIQEIA